MQQSVIASAASLIYSEYKMVICVAVTLFIATFIAFRGGY